MMRSLSRQRITLLEQRVTLLEAQLSTVADHLIEMHDILLHFDEVSQTSGLTFSSNVDTGYGSGDGIRISGRETGDGTSGVTSVTPKSHSRETRNDASMARCEQPTCDIPDGL